MSTAELIPRVCAHWHWRHQGVLRPGQPGTGQSKCPIGNACERKWGGTPAAQLNVAQGTRPCGNAGGPDGTGYDRPGRVDQRLNVAPALACGSAAWGQVCGNATCSSVSGRPCGNAGDSHSCGNAVCPPKLRSLSCGNAEDRSNRCAGTLPDRGAGVRSHFLR